MDQEGNGFVIKDRRRIFKEEDTTKEKEDKQPKGTEQPEETHTQVPLPEVNFSTFILSLSSSALMHLGEIPDPVSKEKRKDLSLAKHTIDIIGMLQEKTKGNLTDNEKKLTDGILYDLRMRYVQQVGK